MAWKKKQKNTDRPSFRTPLDRTGSQKKANVFSYYHNRESADEPTRGRLRSAEAMIDMKQSRWAQFRALPVLLSVVVIVVSLGYNFFLSTSPRIIVGGAESEQMLLKDRSVYSSAVQDTLSDSIFNRTKMTFQADTVRQSITEQFPELQSVRVSLPFMGVKPVVRIEPAKPAMILVANDGASYVLDVAGRVISVDVGRVSEIPDIPVVNDRSGLTSAVGSRLLSGTDITFIQRFLYQLRKQGYAVESLTLPAGTRELQIRLQNVRYVVRVSLREDVLQQSGSFVAIMEYLKQNRVQPTEYVDLRVGERVFYK